MIILNNKKDFVDRILTYDIVLFDFMGVVSNGARPIAGSLETLELLKNNNKIVSFVSNVPSKSEKFQEHLNLVYGIKKDIHYDFVITSGEVFLNIMKYGLLKSKNSKQLKNYYVFGKIDDNDILKSQFYNQVDNINQSDFIYVAYPQLNETEYKKIDKQYTKYLHRSTMYKNDNYYDSTIIDIFLDKIKLFKQYNLPVFSDCSDKVAMQIDADSNKINYVLRQGSITEEYNKIGGEVIDVSKPSSTIFNYTLNIIKNQLNIDIYNKKILMVGDTINCDIVGVNNTNKDFKTNIDSMLLLSGVSGNQFNKNVNEIINYLDNNKIHTDYIADSLNLICQ